MLQAFTVYIIIIFAYYLKQIHTNTETFPYLIYVHGNGFREKIVQNAAYWIHPNNELSIIISVPSPINPLFSTLLFPPLNDIRLLHMRIAVALSHKAPPIETYYKEGCMLPHVTACVILHI